MDRLVVCIVFLLARLCGRVCGIVCGCGLCVCVWMWMPAVKLEGTGRPPTVILISPTVPGASASSVLFDRDQRVMTGTLAN